MENPLNTLWVEKYRPTTFEQMALDAGTRNVLKSFVDAGEIPHLLLAGPPGAGKTTVARILIKSLDCRVLSLNASKDRGIDVVRERIGSFVTIETGITAKWNVVFLDEADAMTADAQTALRNLVEVYAEASRFILTCNYLHKIIGPIQSRCVLLEMSRPPLNERFRILKHVLDSEGIKADVPTMLGYAERYSDLRKMLTNAQRSWLSAKNGTLPPAVADSLVSGEDLLGYLTSKNWVALRKLTTDNLFDPQQALRDLFWAIPDEHKKVGFLRHTIGKGVHESGFSPDAVIHFLGVTAEAMEGL